MDVSEYLPMFLAEGREHLQELNLAVVRIEEQPDDPETIDEIFRIAHSLKGMSATMGFAGMAALTHEMENVFELLRQREDGLGRDAVDVLLRCLDALSEAVDAIEADGTEQIVPEPLIAELRGLVRERTPDQAADRTGGPRRGRRRRRSSWSATSASCGSTSSSPTTCRCPRCAPTWCCRRSPRRARSSSSAPDARQGRRVRAAARSTSGSPPTSPRRR